MNLSEELPTHLDLQTPSTRRNESTAKWRCAKGFLCVPLSVVSAGADLCTPIASPVLAKSGHQADVKDTSAIDPDAMDALNKMGSYLRTLKSFQVTADVATDNVLDDGQTLQFSTKVDLVAVRPNRLRAEIIGDDEHRFLFFDGKNFTIFGQVVNYYATVPAPPTLAELNDRLSEKYGIELPLVDLFQWGTNDATI
ncbi:MAG: DUF2092 domain-containing protein [Candidatus Sulfotelmatobacter sp.]